MAVVSCSCLFAGGKANSEEEPEVPPLPTLYSIKHNSIKNVEDSSFAYFGVHTHPVPFPLPGVDIGYRFKHNNFAVDVSIKYTTAFVANAIQFDTNYLSYFDSTYLGIGVRTAYSFSKDGQFGVVGLDFLVGREFRRPEKAPTFVQLEIYYPTYFYTHEWLTLCPGINIKYGWGF